MGTTVAAVDLEAEAVLVGGVESRGGDGVRHGLGLLSVGLDKSDGATAAITRRSSGQGGGFNEDRLGQRLVGLCEGEDLVKAEGRRRAIQLVCARLIAATSRNRINGGEGRRRG